MPTPDPKGALQPGDYATLAYWSDNITPPHQALGWIPEVYMDTEDLKAVSRKIVHFTNPHVGYLAIFVSAQVA